MVKDTVSDLEDRSKIITQYTQRLSDRKHERGGKNHINLEKEREKKRKREKHVFKCHKVLGID